MTRRRSILLPSTPASLGGRPELSNIDVEPTLSLAPPRMWTRGFLIVCGVVTAISYLLLQEMASLLEMSLPTWAWIAPVGLVAVTVAIRYLLMPPEARQIRFRADDVVLPKGRNSRRTFEVPYDEIRAIVPLVSRGRPALVIQGPRKTHIFVAPDFPGDQDWRVLWTRLTNRISKRPGGAKQLRQMRRMADLSQETSSTKPRFTKHLLWVVAAIFGAQLLVAPDVEVLEFLYFGANSQVMVLEQNQWWRIVTANLLHGNLIHFGVNAFALYFLGTYCERLFGEGRTIVLTLGTAIAGAVASLVGTAAMFAVGISTALFGLLGAYFALHLRYGRQLPPPYHQSWLWWGVILGLNGVLSFAVPIIDAWGHFGGFVAGVALGWLMTVGTDRFEPRRTAGTWMNLAAAGLIALFAGCAIVAVAYGLGDHPDDEVAFAQALVDRADDQEPAMLAQVAHQWSQHSPRPDDINPVLIDISRAAYDRGDDIFVQWRAAASIIRLAEQIDDPFDRQVMADGIERFERMATHHDDGGARRALARILVEYVDEAGALRADDAPFEGARFVDDRVGLTPEATLDEPRRIYLLAVEPGETRRVVTRMLDICIPDSSGNDPKPVDEQLADDREFEIAMVVATAACADDTTNRWRTTEITDPPEP